MPLLLASVGALSIDPARLPLAGRVDPRFQSYNIEMVELTGGRFWKPYRDGPVRSPEDRYAYRPPIDLSNPRLRRLATALGPAYVRVSGTWANTTWYAGKAGGTRPAGFNQTLTYAQLKGLAAYLKAVNGRLVTSFAASAGTRDAQGRWQPGQMQAFLRDAAALGIPVAAAEYVNEPNLVAATGAPDSYTAADWGRDHDRWAAEFRRLAPGALVLGPGSIGDGTLTERAAAAAGVRLLPSDQLLAAQKARLDAFSYHYYGGVSERCATSGPLSVTIEGARDPAWLARTDRALSLYRALRDRFAPGRPIWLTETGQAACGGSRWASGFLDTPRYVDQLARLAQAGVQVVMHNTLAVSDYALLDERDFTPRPSYWAALLWSRLMDPRVLGSAPPSDARLRVYAQCLKGRPGGVALAAINLGSAPADVSVPGRIDAYVLSPRDDERGVALNGRALTLGPSDRLPLLRPIASGGRLRVEPGAVSFAAVPAAGNPACR